MTEIQVSCSTYQSVNAALRIICMELQEVLLRYEDICHRQRTNSRTEHSVSLSLFNIVYRKLSDGCSLVHYLPLARLRLDGRRIRRKLVSLPTSLTVLSISSTLFPCHHRLFCVHGEISADSCWSSSCCQHARCRSILI